MSIRNHELAKRFKMEGKDMLALLKERGYVAQDTKSVSSTLSKIYVEEIEKELGAKLAAAAPAPADGDSPEAAEVAEAAPAAAPEPAEVSKSRMPAGAFVKTAQDVVREKEAIATAKAAAASAASAPRPIEVKPAPPRPTIVSSPL